jgi:plastocyanin
MTTDRARTGASTLAGVAALSLTLLASACSTSSTAAPHATSAADGAVVTTGLLAFDPVTAHIKRGQTVTWVGGDDITHVLVEGTYAVGPDGLRTSQTDDKAFALHLSRKSQRVSHVYDTAGTFTYYCTVHHGMNGTVVVS